MLHKCNGAFVSDAMTHANPFIMCTGNNTFHAYRATMELYDDLLTSIDPASHKEFCSARFLNKNRMSVVTTLLSNSANLWNSANCDECYANKTYNFSNSTKDFLLSLDVYKTCVLNVTTNHTINNTFVCVDCIADYQTLNGFYEQIKKSTNNKICFDLEDKVSEI